MSNSISAVNAQPVAQPVPAAQPAPAKAQPQATAPASDTVQISSAAKQAQQEIVETPAQTAKEAAGGDAVARRLLAKEAADKAL